MTLRCFQVNAVLQKILVDAEPVMIQWDPPELFTTPGADLVGVLPIKVN